jgi:hypothetical protein
VDAVAWAAVVGVGVDVGAGVGVDVGVGVGVAAGLRRRRALTTATTTTKAAIQKTDTKAIWMPSTIGLLPRAAAVDGAQETHLVRAGPQATAFGSPNSASTNGVHAARRVPEKVGTHRFVLTGNQAGEGFNLVPCYRGPARAG